MDGGRAARVTIVDGAGLVACCRREATSTERPSRPVTVAEWLAQPEDARLELIDGELIPKAAPTFEHGQAQVATGVVLGGFARKPGGPDGPRRLVVRERGRRAARRRGYRPDLAGWRRDRVPVMPRERPVTVRPDWLCEIVSESNRATDTIKKLRRYQQAGVPHYWILDQSARALTVYRHHADGYVIVLAAEVGERVRAEPFDAIELDVAALFGDD